ncbi:unnamed protein product [Ectocarpus sp. 8 AP-2014]
MQETRQWPKWRRSPPPTPVDGIDGIPLADIRPRGAVGNGTQLVTAHPAPRDPHPPPAEGGGRGPTPASITTASSTNGQNDAALSSPSSASSSSSSSSSSSASKDPSPTPSPFPHQSDRNNSYYPGNDDGMPLSTMAKKSPPPSPTPQDKDLQPPPPALGAISVDRQQTESKQQPQSQSMKWRQSMDQGRVFGLGGGVGAPAAAAASKTGEYMRGMAAEARAWSARALSGAASVDSSGSSWTRGDPVDPVTMLLPDSASGERVGGPSGRGPLLRRLQTTVYGMLDDFVVVTISRPGPLYVRLKPDSRGLVILNNFDVVPDDPHTSCPRLGSLESVGTVIPGDALASVNREVLLGRPFSECVRCIKEASSSATVARPCVLCFRRADPECLGANLGSPPRKLEQEKFRSLERLLEGGEGGVMDEAKLRGITSTGVPDHGGLRPILWRILLRCLPPNRPQWSAHLETQRALYARFVDDLVLTPAKIVTQGGAYSRSEEASTAVQATPSASRDGDRASSAADRLVDASSGRGAPHPHGKSGGSNAAASSFTTSEKSPRGGKGADDPVLEGQSSEQDVAKVEDRTPSATKPSPQPGVSEHFPGELRLNRKLTKGPVDDDPLSNKDTSEWAALWSDKELMQAIDQDIVRTMPDLAFYACRSIEDNDSDMIGSSASGEGGSGDSSEGERRRRGQERREALARILFVHAKLNPAESYTQGMNEIVATLYFVLASDENEEWNRHCEADTFFCFTNLMSEIRDVFLASMDESESGLHGKMEAFSRTLRQHDPELAEHMVSLALDPRYFALRWFTTLLSREFDLPDTIRLWDSLFAAQDRSTFLVFVFVTLMLAQRETLLAGDFASNLQLLQAYPPTDVPEILAQSEALRLFSARGDAARAGGLAEQRAREAADGAKQAAEQVNAAARRFWNVASDFAAGAAERVAGLNEGAYMADSSGGGTAEAQGLF